MRVNHRGRSRFGLTVVATLAALFGAVASTVGLCRPFATGLAIWDRPLHAPLVSSLGGQLAPFQNVYGHGSPLRYHR